MWAEPPRRSGTHTLGASGFRSANTDIQLRGQGEEESEEVPTEELVLVKCSEVKFKADTHRYRN